MWAGVRLRISAFSMYRNLNLRGQPRKQSSALWLYREGIIRIYESGHVNRNHIFDGATVKPIVQTYFAMRKSQYMRTGWPGRQYSYFVGYEMRSVYRLIQP